MADDDKQVIRAISWRDLFPFTHIFRAFHIATHPSKLVLALLALLLFYSGGRVMDAIWQEHIFLRFLQFEVQQVNDLAFAILSFEWVRRGPFLFESIWNFLAVGPTSLFYEHPVFTIIYGLWFLFIWSIFGGAISRIAAVHLARDEKISLRQALRFSFGKILSFLFAPLIPILITLVLGAVLGASGWILLHISILGPIVLGFFFFLALIIGVVVTLVVLGMLGGFTLMYPTIAVEGSDSFDAFSRSYSYVYQRPWKMLFFTLVAIAYGALTYLFVRFFLWLCLLLTHQFLGWWLADHSQPALYWPLIWPSPDFGHLPYRPGFEQLKWSERLSAGAISFWVYLVIALLGAYALSFFFTANTIIYALLRKDVDTTEMDDVYVEEFEDEFSEALPSTPSSSTTPGPASAPDQILPPEEANNT